MIAKASQQETQGDEGIEVVANEEFEDHRGKGIFTFKKIHLNECVAPFESSPKCANLILISF